MFGPSRLVRIAAAAATLIPVAARAQPPTGGNTDQIALGKYLATIGDCAACHTAAGGKPFAGGQYMPTPFGPISVPNITPDKETGIGSYTDAQFSRVMHEGVGPHGELLYPVMPYPWFTRVTRSDVMAIKAYLFSLKPVHAPRKPIKIGFPWNIRTGLSAWRALFFTAGTFRPDPKASAQVNRGAYLVEGLGHCGECHNANKLRGSSKSAGLLQGGQIAGWYAPNITSDVRTGIGGWSNAQLVTYFRAGVVPGKGVAVGLMARTVHESLSKMKESDLEAIAAYLKSTPARPSYTPSESTLYSSANPPGERTYLSYCASCHQPDGKGIAGIFPALDGNGLVRAKGPQDVIRAVLGGVETQGGYGPMPALGAGMTDHQIAAVTNYVRTAWSNKAPPNAGAGEVQKLRASTHTMLAGNRPNGCPALVEPNTKKAIEDPSNGIKPLLSSVTRDNMLAHIDAILAKVKQAAPQAKPKDVVNSLTIAYCPVLYGNAKLSTAQKAAQLDQFSELVYGQLKQPGGQN